MAYMLNWRWVRQLAPVSHTPCCGYTHWSTAGTSAHGYTQTERRSFKDAGNVTEAKLSTPLHRPPPLLLLLQNTQPAASPAPDLIRVSTTTERRDETRVVGAASTLAASARRVAAGHVSSGRPLAAAEGHAVLSSRPSASSPRHHLRRQWRGNAVMISRWTTTTAPHGLTRAASAIHAVAA